VTSLEIPGRWKQITRKRITIVKKWLFFTKIYTQVGNVLVYIINLQNVSLCPFMSLCPAHKNVSFWDKIYPVDNIVWATRYLYRDYSGVWRRNKFEINTSSKTSFSKYLLRSSKKLIFLSSRKIFSISSLQKSVVRIVPLFGGRDLKKYINGELG